MSKLKEYEICYKFSSNGFARSMLVKAKNKKEVKEKAYKQLGSPKEVYFSEPIISEYIY